MRDRSTRVQIPFVSCVLNFSETHSNGFRLPYWWIVTMNERILHQKTRIPP
ncbi:hypothetical protein RUM4293_01951 [Ruegeria atlantica]|uniref:Uncharacterized protein n=1 Tax=Ruegeria atlantica TaxID=81569 RepID=A0A0P1EMA7_9RHOB|nr:hypothetical protein RUM4293_01951 [Ruegeria atlantica]